jgi:diketogulonate reductase-like aldo/keto reductase
MTKIAHGIDVPALGLGTWKLLGDDARSGVRHALSVGYRHIDTAQIYRNEAEVGEGWKASGVARGDFFLTTKVWIDQLNPADVARSTEESVRKLATDYVDLLLIHWPSREVPVEDTLGAMQRLKERGLTRAIGVSNFTPTQFRHAAQSAELVTNQVEYHPFLSQHALLETLRAEGSLLTAYSPLAQGRVFDQEPLGQIAEAHGASVGQVVLAWLLGQEGVVAIPRSASDAHREDNFGALGVTLTQDEQQQIAALDQGLRLANPDFAPDWER